MDALMLECCGREETPTSRSESSLSEEEDKEEIVLANGGYGSRYCHTSWLPEEDVMSCLSPAPKEFTIESTLI
jgi:hypothetical protein